MEHRSGSGKDAREDTPSKPKSSGRDDEEEDEDREEGEVMPPPHSPLHEDLPSLGDTFSRQARISVGAGWPKRSQTETVSPTGPPPQPHLTLVSPGLQGMRAMLVVMGMTYLLGVL
jgi:hypothetical protein